MDNLPLIQTLWIGSKLSRMENLCLVSYLRNGHPVHLYTYETVSNIPDGVIVKDANLIIPKDKIFKYRNYDSYAGFANLFRYKLLLSEGNFWSDLDVICLKPLLTSDEYLFVSERGINGNVNVNNCLIGVPPSSEIMDYCYTVASKKDPNQLIWGETGPRLLTDAVLCLNLQDYVLAPQVVSVVDCWNVGHFISKQFDDIVNDDVYAIHLYNECWRRNKLDKNMIYKQDCIYERLFDIYSLTK